MVMCLQTTIYPYPSYCGFDTSSRLLSFNGTHISSDDTFLVPLFVPLGSRIPSNHTTARLAWVLKTFICFCPWGLEDRKEQC